MGFDLARLQLLIVEADPAMTGTWRSLLGGFGIRQPRFAAGSRAAWALLQAGGDWRPDLLVCRWELPDGDDGLQLVSRLRGDAQSPAPFLPAIIVTATVTRERVQQALAAGIHEILVLPLSAKAIETRLRETIEKPRRFIRQGGYFGPDRRRTARPGYAGPFRRSTDARPAPGR
ncbi:response regulator [Ferrovibrio sp.]|uniref:response regulator n=1 Tax=Ferrovibrio sp. TaxID=1917215 RepID=UPI00311EC04A